MIGIKLSVKYLFCFFQSQLIIIITIIIFLSLNLHKNLCCGTLLNIKSQDSVVNVIQYLLVIYLSEFIGKEECLEERIHVASCSLVLQSHISCVLL